MYVVSHVTTMSISSRSLFYVCLIMVCCCYLEVAPIHVNGGRALWADMLAPRSAKRARSDAAADVTKMRNYRYLICAAAEEISESSESLPDGIFRALKLLCENLKSSTHKTMEYSICLNTESGPLCI
jgi:hypothetical protein